MHTTSAVTLAATLFASVGLAAPTRRDTSGNFTMNVSSLDGSGAFQNSSVASCHSGAAIEALCVYPGLSATYNFNSTLAGTESPGYLVWTLPSNPQPESQALQLYSESSDSNIGYGFFGTGSGPVELAISPDGNQLGVYVNSSSQQFVWYVCPQTTLGYDYQTVSFVKDFATPTDPNCKEVLLYREF